MSAPFGASPAGQVPGNDIRLISDFLAGHRLPYFVESSVKVQPGRWRSQRRLFGVAAESWSGSTAVPAMGDLLEDLGMPSAAREAFLAVPGRQAVHYLHLGVDGDRRKAYWEFPMPARLDGTAGWHVQYQAWKWRAGDALAAESLYEIVPTAQQARQAIRDLLAELPPLMEELLEQLEVSAALKQYPWPPMTVCIRERLAEQASPRHSLNVHLHEAGLPLGTLAGLMMALSREWESAPRETLVDWIAAAGSERLSNISFGVGEDRQPFFTCYYGGRALHPDSAGPVPHET